MNPVPPVDLTPFIDAPSKIAALKGGLTPLPPVPAVPDLSAMAAPSTMPMLPPVIRPLIQSGSPRAQQENFYNTGIAQNQAWLAPHPEQPGFWHKLGHIANTIRNVAESSVAPNFAVNDPTNPLYHEHQLMQDQHALAGLQSQDQAERQQAEQSAERNRQLDIEQQRADQEGRERPTSPWRTSDRFEGPNGEPVEQNQETGEYRIAQVPAGVRPIQSTSTHPFQHVAGTSGGKEIYANYDPATGVFTDLTGKALTDFVPANKAMQGAYGGFGPAFLAYRMLNSAYNENPALLPHIAPLIAKMLAQPGETPEQRASLEATLGTVPAGQPENEAGMALGLRMPGAPTGATRSRGQFAESIEPSIASAEKQINSLGADLGPMAGRWNELYTGKLGEYGPQFSGLQTDLKNIGAAWMRLHANSETARQEFEGALRGAQSPANLIANLNAIQRQAHDYVLEGKGRPDLLGSRAWTAPEDAPTAPKEDGKFLYADGKAVAKSEGGKWVQP